MVTIKLIGGLGNQMFQYATGRAVAHRLGVQLLLDVSGFAHYDLRRYELDKWAIHASLASPEDLLRAGVVARAPTWFSRIGRAMGFERPLSSFKEVSLAYDPGILKVAAPIYLDGYWQSDSYFSNVADLLRREFVLKDPVNAANLGMTALICQADASSVSLHIRRGDYVSNPHTAQYHGVCSLDYYRAAIDYLAERVPNPHFFVFSDDLAWVAENFKLSHPMTLVDVNDADSGAWDMALMKSCSHHIIANSSFSWWGAWLNSASDKIVVAPARWFSRADQNTRDLIPSTWVRL